MMRLGIQAASSAADMPNTLCGFPFKEKRISSRSAQTICGNPEPFLPRSADFSIQAYTTPRRPGRCGFAVGGAPRVGRISTLAIEGIVLIATEPELQQSRLTKVAIFVNSRVPMLGVKVGYYRNLDTETHMEQR